jgi:drug/metabolite transporter (DMT)-like permease
VERNTGLGIAGSGLLDLTANFLYLVASRRGLLSLVAVLTSMYPASTVLLARVVLGERLTFIQMVGLGVAMSGIVLIAVG